MLPRDSTFAAHRSLRAKLAWITHTRPDISCAISQAAQVTDKEFEPKHIDALNKIIRHLRATPDVKLRFLKLDIQSLKLLVYTDASFANNANLTSQLGYIVVLSDDSGSASIINYQSSKSRRVARSSMASETLAFSHGFDSAFLLRHDLERVLGQTIPMVMFTDSKALFDILTRNKSSTERRLMVDVAAAREAYHDFVISNVGLIKSEHNPADGLTKVGCNDALLSLLRTHRITHPVQQYVLRNGERRSTTSS
jgi:hypothetical protein